MRFSKLLELQPDFSFTIERGLPEQYKLALRDILIAITDPDLNKRYLCHRMEVVVERNPSFQVGQQLLLKALAEIGVSGCESFETEARSAISYGPSDICMTYGKQDRKAFLEYWFKKLGITQRLNSNSFRIIL